MSKTIVLFGAGRSASRLIQYIQEKSIEKNWRLIIADRDEELLARKQGGHRGTETVFFQLQDEKLRGELVAKADLVISMMPAHLHITIAEDCVRLGKNMLTASYVSKEMENLHEAAVDKGLILLNETGVDPGIDHLSAMKMLDELRQKGAEITCFESFTGGLPAPGVTDNPWQYFFSWNPRNVVLAGSGGAVKFRQEGKYKYIPYHQLFRRTEIVNIDGHGRFEGYPNRDSLRYRKTYGLDTVPTIFRGTFRRPGFCKAWDVFVKLGMTDDSYVLKNDGSMTHREFVNFFLAYHPGDSVELKLMHYLNIPQDSDIMEKLEWIELFSNDPVELEEGTPAQILEYILMKKWAMKPNERDMIVMFHKIGYMLEGENKMIHASMVYEGKSRDNTAMSDTVGLPLGIAAELMLDGKVQQKGVCLPITPDIYLPMLEKLKEFGIGFQEKEVPYQS
ncbi:MAG: saccharopine dehydrogenase NADP-binding domain-containing protein [Cryomorphaceae bacterium]|nr:saccharopine dehydrogenase NADP-binding domain-containing protein [Cryomorphaceae bacterium]